MAAEGFVVTVWNTALGVTCNYTAGGGLALGHYTADATGKDGVVKVNAVVNRTTEHSGSIFCPSTSTWTAEYTYTGTKPLFVAEG